ncbi:MAG: hypothetical protein GEV08_21735 [Acidimicrobiia bacterium]|nr:hypothetical protein [Acidimicrobiia bacterium]
MERAREEGVGLVGPGGLLSGLTKTVLETALEGELSGLPALLHLGPAERPASNLAEHGAQGGRHSLRHLPRGAMGAHGSRASVEGELVVPTPLAVARQARRHPRRRVPLVAAAGVLLVEVVDGGRLAAAPVARGAGLHLSGEPDARWIASRPPRRCCGAVTGLRPPSSGRVRRPPW